VCVQEHEDGLSLLLLVMQNILQIVVVIPDLRLRSHLEIISERNASKPVDCATPAQFKAVVV
jgi:hypothetical protein